MPHNLAYSDFLHSILICMLEKYQKLNSNEILKFQVHRSGSPHSAFTNVLSELKSRKSSVDSNIKVGKIEQQKVSCYKY